MVEQPVLFNNVTVQDTLLLQRFLENAGNSLNGFRYYASRPFTVIRNHVITTILTVDGEPIGYGHLDKDGETIWLGIAVQEKRRGQGFGNEIMQHLISVGDKLGLNYIALTVDVENSSAIELYRKYGFVEVGPVNATSIKMIRTSEAG